jgi:hypothetical protein
MAGGGCGRKKCSRIKTRNDRGRMRAQERLVKNVDTRMTTGSPVKGALD